MVDLQDLVAFGTISKQGWTVQFYYTQESELKDANHGWIVQFYYTQESFELKKTPTVVNGPRFVCIAQNVINPNMQLVTLGVHLKFFGKKFYMCHTWSVAWFRV